MTPGGPERIPSILLGILEPSMRAEAIQSLAGELKADVVILFLADPEVNLSLPAPGFAQRVPRLSEWRELVNRAVSANGKVCAASLPFPDVHSRHSALGVGYEDGTALIALGGAPREEEFAQVHAWLPWVSKAFRAETLLRIAKAREALAHNAAHESDRTASILDGLRRNLEDALRKVESEKARSRREITHRKEMEQSLRDTEEQLRQSQKMKAIGGLAGGIAHDFNNLLTAINGYSELALHEAETSDTLREYLLEIRKSGERAAALTQQLLAFSRKQVLMPKIISLNAVVAEMEKMLGRLIGEDVKLVTRLDPDLGLVRVDPNQLEQILLNLALNSRDAMPRGGKLILETANVDFRTRGTGSHLEIAPGRHAMLSVTDTGIGMTPEVKARIFEPFFTTKEVGKGTGLGLSSVYGIVKQSEGGIYVYSEPRRGTVFKIYFPLAAEGERPDPVPDAPEASGFAESGKTILLVEDETVVRNYIHAALRRMGLEVVEAGDGESALRAFAEHGDAIEILLTDMIMPGMNGRELAAKLRADRPDLKVLYMSGYTEHSMLNLGVLEPRSDFIQKPFDSAQLFRKLESLFLALA